MNGLIRKSKVVQSKDCDRTLAAVLLLFHTKFMIEVVDRRCIMSTGERYHGLGATKQRLVCFVGHEGQETLHMNCSTARSEARESRLWFV